MEGKGEGEGSVKIFIHGTKARDTWIVNNLKRSRPPRHDFARRFRSAVKRSELKFLQSRGRSLPLRHPPFPPEQTIRNSIKSDSRDIREKEKKRKNHLSLKEFKICLNFSCFPFSFFLDTKKDTNVIFFMDL